MTTVQEQIQTLTEVLSDFIHSDNLDDVKTCISITQDLEVLFKSKEILIKVS